MSNFESNFSNQATRIMEEYDLLQCIDKGLDGFGSSVKNAIFWRLTILHNSSRSEVISDPKVLVQVIRETFGSSASAIETSITDEIGKKFQLSTKGTRSLVEAIGEAKNQVIVSYSPGQKFEISPNARR